MEDNLMNANLVRVKKNGDQKVFPLTTGSITIGRKHDCDLQIPLDSVSKKHCQLSCEKGVWKIRDLGSHNGTFLNGKKIEEAEIQPGSSLTIGPVTFVLQVDGKPDLDISLQNAPPQPQTIAPPETPPENLELKDDQFADFSDLNLDNLEGLESLEEDSDSA
jgi:pSer/pThr/pTyr-binding forkhead associated (FHA) protein